MSSGRQNRREKLPDDGKEQGFDMNISCLLFGILFLTAGALFALGRLHERIAAWQKMSEAERHAVDIVPLCRNIGGMIMLCGLIFLAAGVFDGFFRHAFVWAMIAWMILSGFDVWYIEKSGRYIHHF